MLGVIGRADQMHAILDVETHTTIGYLDRTMQDNGGRRGRDATPTPTGGLVYAVTRHGTSRAGDPSSHDHILIANVTYMGDQRGGYKALFSALLRDRVEAATMYGRLCSAWEAVQRGYVIERDDGPSGRLRHWRIAGIPQEVCDLMSKRSDAIGEYLSERGYVGYRAANVAARATRETKRGTGIDELMPRWHAELAEIGWPVKRIVDSLETARTAFAGPPRPLSNIEIDRIAAQLCDPDGAFLARGKVFSRSRMVTEVAPMLYGHDPAELDPVLDRIIASPLVVPLIGIAGAREQMYTAMAVLETEHAIAACTERLIDQPGPQLDPARVLSAIALKQNQIGAELTDGQYAAINAVCGSGRAVDVVVGIAGSGKTTALDAAATALEDAGYTVVGTATAGQAARTLGTEAGIEARTMRSLLGRLDRGDIVLDRRSVVILDEAGMTADADMARLLLAVESARAKLVIVGDDRQLSAVGPGGALHALLGEHPEIVTALTENLRQRDPAEADALLDLRDGNLDQAIAFYQHRDRIAVAPDRTDTLVAMVDAWATDIQAGHDTLLLAWQRTSVADLNRVARDTARRLGWLTGPDLELADGRRFAVGDQVVMLAPNYRGQLVTSERARVVDIDADAQALTLSTEAGRQVTLLGSELDRDRIDHGYAITVHREQGATSDRAHYFADGGGRELAYVAMSRSRDCSTVHIAADDVDQAAERIRDDWTRIQHETWITPDAEAGHDPRHQPATLSYDAQRARLVAELDATLALAPPPVTNDLLAAMATLDRLEQQQEHLHAGTGPYAGTELGRIRRDLLDLERDLDHARAAQADARPWQRPKWGRLVDQVENHHAARTEDWLLRGHPEAERLNKAVATSENRVHQLQADDNFNRQWHRDHPEHAERVRGLKAAIHELDRDQQMDPPAADHTARVGDHLDPRDRDLLQISDGLDQPGAEHHPELPAAADHDDDLMVSLADDLANVAHDPDAADRLIARLDQLTKRPDPGIDPPRVADGGLGR